MQKPEKLPAIEQWLEYVYVDKESREKLRIPHSESQQQQQHATTAGRRQQAHTKGAAAGADGSPMGNFSAGVRPGLVPRTTGGKNGGEYFTVSQ